MKRKEKGTSFFQIMLKIVDFTRLFGFSSPTPFLLFSPFLRRKGEGKFPRGRGKEKGIEKDLVRFEQGPEFLFSSPLSERRKDKGDYPFRG